MKIDKDLVEELKKTAKEKNLSPYDMYEKFHLSTVVVSKLFKGYTDNASERNIEKIKKIINSDMDPLEENTDQRLQRELKKLLEVFKTRIDLAVQLGTHASTVTKLMTGERPSANETLVKRIDKLYKDLEKQNFNLGELNIEEFLEKYAYEKVNPEEAPWVDTKKISREDYKRALEKNKRTYKKLIPGKAYKITLPKYLESGETETYTLVILEEYKRFYLGADRRGVKKTILKNDLYNSSTKIKKLN